MAEADSEKTTAPPDSVDFLDGGEFLFKHDGGLFKQVFGPEGKLVGLLYQKQGGGDWTALGLSQVRSRADIYRRRAVSGNEAACIGAAFWAWAFSLFDTAASDGAGLQLAVV